MCVCVCVFSHTLILTNELMHMGIHVVCEKETEREGGIFHFIYIYIYIYIYIMNKRDKTNGNISFMLFTFCGLDKSWYKMFLESF